MIEIEIRKDEIEIDGFNFKPYWKRIVLALCWWKTPKIILKNPNIFYRFENGELWDLEKLTSSQSNQHIQQKQVKQVPCGDVGLSDSSSKSQTSPDNADKSEVKKK